MLILRYYNPVWYPPGLDEVDGEQSMVNDEGISTDTDSCVSDMWFLFVWLTRYDLKICVVLYKIKIKIKH